MRYKRYKLMKLIEQIQETIHMKIIVAKMRWKTRHVERTSK